MSNITVVVDGQKVNLTDNDYLTQGGEGIIYIKNNAVFKIAHNTSNLIHEDKIAELQVLSDVDNVVIPSKPVYDHKSHKHIGYVMKYLSNTESLCKLFTGNFRKKHNITPQNIVSIINNMQTTLTEIHKRGILVGDYNDMNILMGDKLTRPYHIDVDSFQTPSFKGTAIMASVQDYSVPMGEFTELTDWYSFAVVSFNLYAMIHPLKGKHPKFKMNDFEARQKHNISVFDKAVTVPKFVNMSGIPKAHLEWYKEVFANGDRSIPPFSDGKINYSVMQKVVTDVNSDIIATLIMTLPGTIIDYRYVHGNTYMLTTNGFYQGEIQLMNFSMSIDDGYIMSIDNKFLFVIEYDNNVYVYDENKTLIHKFDNINYKSYMVANDCLYIMLESGLVQYSFEYFGKFIMISTPISTININAAKVFDGVVIQEMYGKYKAIIPYMYTKCSTVDLKELKTNLIHDAKIVGKWLFVLANDKGQIKLHKFLFNDSFTKYEHKSVDDVSMRNINATIMPNDMVVFNTDDETIELFFDFNRGTKVIDKSPIQNNLKLITGKTACFIDDDKIYSVRMT